MLAQNGNVKIYRHHPKSILFESCYFLFLSLFNWISVGAMVIYSGQSFRRRVNISGVSSLLNAKYFIWLFVVLLVLVVWAVIWFYLTRVVIGRLFNNTLKISSSGLEHHIYPYYTLICGWSDVDRLEKLFIQGQEFDVLYLKNATLYGWPILKKIHENISRANCVYLNGFESWPEGDLADDLRQYAPHVFKDEMVIA